MDWGVSEPVCLMNSTASLSDECIDSEVRIRGGSQVEFCGRVGFLFSCLLCDYEFVDAKEVLSVSWRQAGRQMKCRH